MKFPNQIKKLNPHLKLTKKKAALLAAVCLLACGTTVYALKGSGNSSSTVFTPYTIDVGTIATSISGSGTLSAAKTYTLTASVTGDVLSDDLEIGDTVTEGQVLYTIDDSDAYEDLNNASLSLKQQELSTKQAREAVNNLTITAPISGTVTNIYVSEGDEINTGTQIADIIDNEHCTLKVLFNTADTANINVGDTATVYLLDSGETISGTVKRIGTGAYYNTTGAYVNDVEITFTNPSNSQEEDTGTAIINGYAASSTGTISYTSATTLTAETSGTITALNISANDSVTAGDLLVQLENEDTVLQGEAAELSLSNAQQSYGNKEEALDEYVIEAPCDGTVLSKSIQAGDTLTEKGTQLAIVADMSSMKFTMSIDELDIKNVEVGQTVTVTADAVSKVYTGEITAIVLNGTSSNGVTVYPVTVTLTECDDLLPGMNVTAEIITEQSSDTLRAPINCVSRNDMLLIDEATAKSLDAETVESTRDAQVGQIVKSEDYPGYYFLKVETGISNSEYTEITNGASEGLQVYAVTTQGSNSNGEPNMVDISSSSNSNGGMNFGGMPGGGGGMPSGGPGGGF